MTSARLAALLGVACLALAAWAAPAASPAVADAPTDPDGAPAARPLVEPVAEALRPLGPVRAVAAAVLWAMVRSAQHEGDAATVADLSEGLLALHPDLDEVRVFLARQLVVTWAPRRADPERHEALVARGLRLLEEGFDADGDVVDDRPHGGDGERRGGDARLHGALGTLLALQPSVDPRFAPVAARYFGEHAEEVAIDQLRRGRPGTGDSVNLVLLLVDRGIATLQRDGDLYDAERDLAEAEAVLEEFTSEERSLLAPELEPLRRLVEEERRPEEGPRS